MSNFFHLENICTSNVGPQGNFFSMGAPEATMPPLVSDGPPDFNFLGGLGTMMPS